MFTFMTAPPDSFGCRPGCGACCTAPSISSPIPGMPEGKPAGVLGVSIGAAGTAMAQQHLRNVLSYLDVPTLGQPEVFIHAKEGVFDASGNLGESTQKFMRDWLSTYLAFVERHGA